MLVPVPARTKETSFRREQDRRGTARTTRAGIPLRGGAPVCPSNWEFVKILKKESRARRIQWAACQTAMQPTASGSAIRKNRPLVHDVVDNPPTDTERRYGVHANAPSTLQAKAPVMAYGMLTLGAAVAIHNRNCLHCHSAKRMRFRAPGSPLKLVP